MKSTTKCSTIQPISEFHQSPKLVEERESLITLIRLPYTTLAIRVLIIIKLISLL